MKKTVLITGSNGFLGVNLAVFLEKRGDSGLYLTDIRPPQFPGPVETIRCDLTDPGQVVALIAQVKPDQIYHLAGVFSGDYEAHYRANVLAAKNLFDAVKGAVPACRILVTGSAAEYGCPASSPVSENCPLNPINLYGFTKMLQTRLAEFYARVYGLDVVIARPFTILGKGASENLFIGRVMRQIDDYKRGETSKIIVGGLDSVRDYLKVEDAVTAFELIMKNGSAGTVYNVASGIPVRMCELLETLLLENNIPRGVVKENSPSLLRQAEVKEIYADISRLLSLKPSALS